ncbi:MAG TPA: ribbon-helix-helix domain-containing protein [Herpetosiphonaceae bacterium]|nr:ribbon-helix-helix domain-containing protein [Herpetosiphonaceae bacterium]
MTKRSSLFSIAPDTSQELTPGPVVPISPLAPAEAAEAAPRKYPVAKTREGKRVATVYLEKEALRQLQKLAFDEETTLQALLVEGVNSVFAARGLSRIA